MSLEQEQIYSFSQGGKMAVPFGTQDIEILKDFMSL